MEREEVREERAKLEAKLLEGRRLVGEREERLREALRCACCGSYIEDRSHSDPWEGRLDAYCEGCATTRCDAYPGECGRPKLALASSPSPPDRLTKEEWRSVLFELRATDEIDYPGRTYGKHRKAAESGAAKLLAMYRALFGPVRGDES